MPSINPITTTAGRAAILAAVAAPSTVVVEDAQLSDTDQAVTIATTALTNVVATLDAVGSVRVAGSGHALHVVIKDDSGAAYDVRALALRLTGGVFLMVYSQAGLIATKAAGSSLHLALDLTVDADTAATVDFGDTDYVLPAGGEASPGLVELATTAEVLAGVDTVRAVTPAGFAALTATDTRAGIVELATSAEVNTGTDAFRAVTPAGLAGRTATETRLGIIELASAVETIAGADADRAVTPSTLAAKLADFLAALLAGNQTWTGDHDFDDTVTIESLVISTTGVQFLGGGKVAGTLPVNGDITHSPARARKHLLSPVVFAGQSGATYDPDTDTCAVTGADPVSFQLNGMLPDNSRVTQIRMGVVKGNTSLTELIGKRRVPDLTVAFTDPETFAQFGADSSTTSGDVVLDTGDTSADTDALLDTDAHIHLVQFHPAAGTVDTVRWIEISYTQLAVGKL